MIFKWAWSAQCIGRVHPECGDNFHAYNTTFYPNLLGQWTAGESKVSFSEFYPLRQMECSPHLDLFLCSTLSPACANDELSGKPSVTPFVPRSLHAIYKNSLFPPPHLNRTGKRCTGLRRKGTDCVSEISLERGGTGVNK